MTPDLCPNCGAPMAADQRYCLQCGERRSAPRVTYTDLLAAGAPAGPAAPDPPPEAGAHGPWTLTAGLATIACLLLAVAIGVLIGRGGDSAPQAAAPAPQVIRVDGAAPAASTTTTPDTVAKQADTAKAGKRHTKDTSEREPQRQSAGEQAADDAAVKSLEEASPEEYQQQAQKLPKEVGTGGQAPPKDNKAPAAGGAFEEIG